MLTNLDVDEDDLNSFDVWSIGIDKSFDTVTSTPGVLEGEEMTDSELSFCTIPASCTVPPWNTMGLHSSTSQTHWSHVHWQALIELEEGAQSDKVPGSTERHVEYSTDNGATWRNAWWWRDENHHGRNRASDVETIVYRFRFHTNLVDGTWKIDDVALSSDDETAGYYTNFNQASDPSQ